MEHRPFLHHVEHHMSMEHPLFVENTGAKGKVIIDSNGSNAKIVEEHMWVGLNVPSASQEDEGVACVEIAVTDTIQMRKQIQEKRSGSNNYFGGVVGDKLSPKHVKTIHPIINNGYNYLNALVTTPVTTRLEFEEKQKTNIVKNQTKTDMTGCSCHTIRSYQLIWGDYHPGGTRKLRDQFNYIRRHLTLVGPLFGSLRDYGDRAVYLGLDSCLCNMVPGDEQSTDVKFHAVSIVGWGRCEFEDGSQDIYWVVQNTWGETFTKFGRLSNDLLKYAVAVEV